MAESDRAALVASDASPFEQQPTLMWDFRGTRYWFDGERLPVGLDGLPRAFFAAHLRVVLAQIEQGEPHV